MKSSLYRCYKGGEIYVDKRIPGHNRAPALLPSMCRISKKPAKAK